MTLAKILHFINNNRGVSVVFCGMITMLTSVLIMWGFIGFTVCVFCLSIISMIVGLIMWIEY